MNKKKIIYALTWVWMLIKRYFKNPFFVATLLSIPVLVICLKFVSGADEAVVRVALYAPESASDYTVEAMNRLINDKTGAVVFYRAGSVDSFYDEVKTGYATCGFIYPEKLEQEIVDFIESKGKKPDNERAIITMVDREQTNYVKISRELVFGSFYDNIAKLTREKYIAEDKNTADRADEVNKLIDSYMDTYDINDQFFEYKLLDGHDNAVLNEQSNQMLMLPMKGLIFNIILLAGMMGVVTTLNDMEKGVFAAIQRKKRKVICYWYVLVPTIIAAVSGLVAWELSQTKPRLLEDIFIMILYIFLVTGTCGVLMRVFKGVTQFVSIIPIYILMNLFLCPVFVSVADVLPQMEYFKLILPVNYAMMGYFNIPQILIAVFITSVICYIDVEEI
ncbi:MAG: hypothetical protein IKN54_03095 [Lachnospiraceae bacterium]|nr:hypothetical protein [Lachnospiraceae bacterium]